MVRSSPSMYDGPTPFEFGRECSDPVRFFHTKGM